MATTKITAAVLDLNAGRADYNLTATNTVTYVSSTGGNQYVFNGAYGTYGVVNGTYVLSSVSSSHPIAIINNGKTSEISYTGTVNEGTGTGPDGNTYTFYSGDVTITVSGNFDTVSYYCQNHGYMGGKDNLIYVSSVGESGLKIPSGTEFNRPTAATGQIRNNTNETSEGSASAIEYYNGTDWKKISNIPLPTFDYLVLAGGAAGGANWNTTNSSYPSGGGGAGGLRTSYGTTSGGGCAAESSITLASGTYTITVGAGGNEATSYGSSTGSSGSASSISGNATVNTVGGGGGAGMNGIGSGRGADDGGCGGGGGAYFYGTGGYGGSNPGAGTACEGYNGGTQSGTGPSGGGGGTGAVGGNRDGGAGLSVSITGSSVAYGGGGGGGQNVNGAAGGAGGVGGGGAGSCSCGARGTAGTVNTGGGGGAAGYGSGS